MQKRWHEGGWCRRCVRMWSNCDLKDGECARHHHAARAAELEAVLRDVQSVVWDADSVDETRRRIDDIVADLKLPS